MTQPRNARGRFTANANGNGHVTRIERSPQLVQRMPHSLVKAQGQRVDLDEIGTSGLRHYGGFVLEEWLRQLQGSRAAYVYREMSDNDPVIGAIIFAIEMLARNAEWSVKQGKDADSAEFVESCMDDMSHTWDDLVSEALSMLTYGWSYHEIVYKRRQGEQPELPMDQAEAQGATQDVASSAFDDGRIGWRKIPVRAQETLLRWSFDDRGGTQSMQQVDYQGHYHIIPVQKALLFRPRARRGNPEGRSLLRNAFVPWYRLKNIQEIEAIGIERDLAGLPVATPPPGVDLFASQNANLLAEVQKLVTTIRRDEDEGVVLPQAEWKLELLTTGGSRQIDTDAIVRRYEQRIASSVLADFILIGQDSVGSYAMVDVKSDVFGIALDTILDMVADVINRYAISRLLRLNGLPTEDPPQVAHGSTGRVDLQRIATFLELLSTAGAPIPWSHTLIETLFQEAGIPAEFEEAGEQAPEQAPVQDATPPGDDKQPGSQPAAEQNRNELAPNSAALPASKPVSKADTPTVPAGHQLAVRLRQRARQLEHKLTRDVARVLDKLGTDAQLAYLSNVTKADTPPSVQDKTLVERILAAMSLPGAAAKLRQIFRANSQRVMRDSAAQIKATIGLQVNIPDPVARQIVADGGTRAGLIDLDAQIRSSLYQAIAEGRAQGEGPAAIARRIRELVPAGPFPTAGPEYRASLIARTETLNAQRLSCLAAYRAAESVTQVLVHDGLLDSSDEECTARDGDIVDFDEADALAADEHPNGTLSFSPIVGTPDQQQPSDEAAAAVPVPA